MSNQELTIKDLVDRISQNCPPNCLDKVLVSDNLTGDAGPVINVRYRHTENGMVLELIVDGGLGSGMSPQPQKAELSQPQGRS